MPARYPYTTAPGYVAQIIAALRGSFPAQLNPATLRKLGVAPSNESSTLAMLRYLGFIDSTGNRTARAAALMGLSDEQGFGGAFAALLEDCYRELFEIRGDNAWNLPLDELVTYFSQADGTSPKVARLQARTFQALAQAAGRYPLAPEPAAPRQIRLATGAAPEPAARSAGRAHPRRQPARGINLTLHLDLHLPPGADQATYDRIFRAIREQLLQNGE